MLAKKVHSSQAQFHHMVILTREATGPRRRLATSWVLKEWHGSSSMANIASPDLTHAQYAGEFAWQNLTMEQPKVSAS